MDYSASWRKCSPPRHPTVTRNGALAAQTAPHLALCLVWPRPSHRGSQRWGHDRLCLRHTYGAAACGTRGPGNIAKFPPCTGNKLRGRVVVVHRVVQITGVTARGQGHAHDAAPVLSQGAIYG